VFFGEYTHTMDASGRVSLPSQFRSQLPRELKVVKGLDKCVWLFTNEAYEKFRNGIQARAEFDELKGAHRKILRMLHAGTQDVELDKPGRIRLGQDFRDYASLDKEVVVTGNGDRIELWDPNEWDKYTSGVDIEDLVESLAEQGLR